MSMTTGVDKLNNILRAYANFDSEWKIETKREAELGYS